LIFSRLNVPSAMFFCQHRLIWKNMNFRSVPRNLLVRGHLVGRIIYGNICGSFILVQRCRYLILMSGVDRVGMLRVFVGSVGVGFRPGPRGLIISLIISKMVRGCISGRGVGDLMNWLWPSCGMQRCPLSARWTHLLSVARKINKLYVDTNDEIMNCITNAMKMLRSYQMETKISTMPI
jgi:hypothetical protein